MTSSKPNCVAKGPISKYHHIGVTVLTWILRRCSSVHSINQQGDLQGKIHYNELSVSSHKHQVLIKHFFSQHSLWLSSEAAYNPVLTNQSQLKIITKKHTFIFTPVNMPFFLVRWETSWHPMAQSRIIHHHCWKNTLGREASSTSFNKDLNSVFCHIQIFFYFCHISF